MALTLYHGTSVGWLMQPGEGFTMQDNAYGEASPPHKFIYLCTKWDGAESAAFTSKRLCERRIRSGALNAAHFVKNNPPGIPTRAVYTLIFQDPDEIDWRAEVLSGDTKERVIGALKSLYKEARDRGSYLWRRVAFALNWITWQQWVDTATKKHCAELRSVDDKRVSIFKRGGYTLVRNLEKFPSNYGETVAWILPVQPVQPANCAFV